MNKLRTIAMLSIAVMMASSVMARDALLPIPLSEERVFTAPAPNYVPEEPFVGEIVQGPVYVDAAPVPLFTNVKYVDLREKHPCAVSKIIRVNDPCDCHDACNSCCPKCVYIEICVPPCDCEEDIRCRRDGDRVRYDYGKYKVDVRVKKGFIVVDYQK